MKKITLTSLTMPTVITLLIFGTTVEASAAETEQVVVDCAAGDSISAALTEEKADKPLLVVVDGVCAEDVTVTADGLAIQGSSTGGTVDGSIRIVAARRVVVRDLTITGPGPGVWASENASFMVEDSTIDNNGAGGIEVLEGAHANIMRNTITNNGQASPPNRGRGIYVHDGGSANIRENTIADNRSDGIGVFDNAYAKVEQNTIERNGRPAPVFDAGIQVGRARVRANGNVIKDNGYAAVEVFNAGDYRTGSFLNSEDQPDNAFDFEIIEGVGPGRVAVDIGQGSYVDLRQVNVRGTVFVGRQSMLQVRGDNVPPNQQCSTIDTASGSFQVFGFNSGARLRTTNVIGAVFGGPIDGSLVCP